MQRFHLFHLRSTPRRWTVKLFILIEVSLFLIASLLLLVRHLLLLAWHLFLVASLLLLYIVLQYLEINTFQTSDVHPQGDLPLTMERHIVAANIGCTVF